MPRHKQPAAPATPNHAPTDDRIVQLTAAVEQLTEELQATREDLRTVRDLAQEVRVLRDAIDDVRQELEWTVKNLHRPAWAPTPPVTSMPRDPLAEDFQERVNRFTAKDLPPEQRPEQAGQTPGESVYQRDLFDY